MIEMLSQFRDVAFQILFAIIIAICGFIVIKIFIGFIKKVFGKTKIEHTVKTFIVSAIRVMLYLILLIAVLSELGINVSSIVAAVGAAALTAGLALQSTLTNIASGIIILVSKPFVAGDVLIFDGKEGKVLSIKIFSTEILTFDNKTVTIPNSRLTTNDVINCSTADKRRLDLEYVVSYEDDIQKVKNVIAGVIKSNDKIMSEPEHEIYVGEYLDSGIQIIVRVWVEYKDYYDVYFYMQENIKLAFDKNGITIPYPHILVKK